MPKDIIFEDAPKKKETKSLGFGSLLDFSRNAQSVTKFDERSVGMPELDERTYRHLEETELVDFGDEFWHRSEKKWIKTTYFGRTPNNILGFENAHKLYRRFTIRK